MRFRLDRRQFLAASSTGIGCLATGLPISGAEDKPAAFRLATFEADVTPPLGHPLLGGLVKPAESILDRLSARGLVLLSNDKPLVICSLDWCELRNDAYDAFRDTLAKAARTDRERVLLNCNHQHDAPYFDLTAQKLLDAAGHPGLMFDSAFFDRSVAATADALTASLAKAKAATHVGAGQAEVKNVACNRRVVGADGKVRFNRYSRVADPAIKDAPEGLIDPLVKTLSFWNADEPLATISVYATHPMSYYGQGQVSYDFPGMAREMRQRANPATFQLYMTGCSGDVVAAKFNDGTPEGRRELAESLAGGMQRAFAATKRQPLTSAAFPFRVAKLELPPPDTGKFTIEALEQIIADPAAGTHALVHAAMGLSYRRRCDRGQPIDVPAIDFGPAQIVILPAELFVGYQLSAAKMRPDQLILTPGFGECAPGYTPTDEARQEGFVEEHGYCWVREGVERTILKAIGEALGSHPPVDR